MKQKVTMKVQMERETCRNKAFQICATVKGVSSVSMNEKEQLVVTGEDIDTVCLGKLLKKKFCSVTVLTVEEVKPKAPEEKKKEEKKPKPKPSTICIVPFNPPSSFHSTNCHSDSKPSCLILPKPNPNCHGTCKSCTNCESLKCHGDCKPCSKCESLKCHGSCKPCLRCESFKCHESCKPCSRCESFKCNGSCTSCTRCGSFKCYGSCKPCFRCESLKCHGSCKQCFRCGSFKCDGGCFSSSCVRPPCFGKCPPWISCSSCCIKIQRSCREPCDDIYVYIYLFVVVVIVISVFLKSVEK